MSVVFISYSRVDRPFVHRLVNDLEREGISVFFDQRVKPGDSWADSISGAIEDAKFLLLVLSPEYVESSWAQEEMKIGLLRESVGRSKVIPLMLRKCEPPPIIGKKAYANFVDEYDVGLRQLMPVLKESLPKSTSGPMPGSTTQPEGTDELKNLHIKLAEEVALFRTHQDETSQRRRVTTDNKKCFVVMPFGNPDLQAVYEEVVRPGIEERSLVCERGDDVFGSNVVMDDIRASIESAAIVIADLTGKNANVFYEIGIAHAIGKPVLLMVQSMDDVPFDLRHRRVLLYENTLRGGKRLEKALRENLSAMLEKIV